jgi:hypothetical protein
MLSCALWMFRNISGFYELDTSNIPLPSRYNKKRAPNSVGRIVPIRTTVR